MIIPSVFDYILAGLGELASDLAINARWGNGALAAGLYWGSKLQVG